MISIQLSASRPRLSAIRFSLFALVLWAGPAMAQEAADERPAFSLSTSQVFTTKDAPNFYLTFRRIPTLDVRVYKVKDPFTFFSSLKDPHQLGSEEPYVPQERSWIERLADWKRWQRQEVQSFARRQVSHTYRASRRADTDKSQVSQRVTLNVNTFAQVPLLNPDQLVTSWRELLPNHRDPEVRRVPLDVKTPGIFVVEAVHDLIRAYTVVIVSDVGLVTKTSPGQLVMFAANRFTGEPAAACGVRVLANQKTLGEGQTSADGLFEASLPDEKLDDVDWHRAVRRADGGDRPGVVVAAAASTRTGRLHLHRQAHLSTRAHGAGQGRSPLEACATHWSHSIGPRPSSSLPTPTTR